MIQFDLPKEKSSILKVIGIGGGGGNAVNHMFGQKIEGVNFIICNTDAQALATSDVPNKIQLGPHLTQGLGAGANPEIGREATEESLEEIRRILEVNTKMAFITAGMGGGTGTGGAPIVAKICKDLGILTVGIVTTPFTYEGKKRMAQAQLGIQNLKGHVDTLLVISNDKLRHQFGNLTMKAAFSKADNVLATAAKCITDVINSTGQINVDFADVCTVMRNGGVAILGSAECEGENRAQKAIEQALNSPLLNDNDISGAKWILININSAEGEHEFTMDEVDTIQTYLLSRAGEGTDVILGLGYNNDLQDKIGITLIATGFEDEESRQQKKAEVPIQQEPPKEILELKGEEKKITSSPLFLFDPNNEVVVEKNQSAEPEKKKEGLREDEVMAALKEEAKSAIDIEMKPEIVTSAEEQKKSILDIPVQQPRELHETPARDIVFFDLTTEQEEPYNPIIDNSNIYSKENDNTGFNSNPQKAGSAFSSKELPVKPSHVYVEKAPVPKPTLNPSESLSTVQNIGQDDEPAGEMQLVEKNSNEAADKVVEEKVRQTMPIMMSDAEELPMADKAEEIKRRAMDRINKLRNLSYNKNGADPNNEFESVPAYIRRNLELHNSIANVESFYSNYTVGSDENNKTKISTINSFLQGKKPD